MFPLDILLEDGPLLAVNKPAGLATQAPTQFPSLETCVKEHLRHAYAKTGNVYLGTPHRLDRPVSGVVVFAKNSKAAARLAEQFHDRQVTKRYWAVLEGAPPLSEGTLRDHLRKIPDAARAEVVAPDHPEGRLATLSYRVLGTVPMAGRSAPATLVEIELGTGRMHQIRVQFGSRGCPIVGDATYGSTVSLPSPVGATAPTEEYPVGAAFAGAAAKPTERILLHARTLILKHPIRYDRMQLTASVPEAWPVLPAGVGTAAR